MSQIQTSAHEAIYLEALGHTWYFTPDVVSSLVRNGADPREALRTIILTSGSLRGYEEGVHHLDSFGRLLRFTVRDQSIIVDDPSF